MTMKSAICIAFLLIAAPTIHAQHLEQPRGRQGYWASVGLTQGASSVRDKGEAKGLYYASGFTIRIGELMTERLGLGLFVEYNGITKKKTEAGITAMNDKGTAGGLGIEGTYCPWRTLGLRAGFGFGFSSLTDHATEEKTIRTGYGKYMALGASYEFFPWRSRLSGGWAVTPSVDFRAMPDGNVHVYSGYASLAVTWWSGRDKSMLVLPED